MPAPTIATNTLIDEILDEHRAAWSEGDEVGWIGYRNHAQRVFLFARHLAEPRPDAGEKIAIIAAFHDIAVFQTLDYLVPNLRVMEAWLAAQGRLDWHREIALAMTMHHRVRPYRGEAAWLVEPMRRADWIEVTAGRVHPGVPGELVRQAQRELPMGSFATKSGLRIVAHALTHPLDPMPFWRSGRALRQLK
jgi:hypothetical protein